MRSLFHSLNTSFQHTFQFTLFPHFVSTFCRHTLPTHPLNPRYQPILITHPPTQHLSTHTLSFFDIPTYLLYVQIGLCSYTIKSIGGCINLLISQHLSTHILLFDIHTYLPPIIRTNRTVFIHNQVNRRLYKPTYTDRTAFQFLLRNSTLDQTLNTPSPSSSR